MKNFLNISNITGQQAEGFTGYHMGTHSLFWMPHFEASNSENAYLLLLQKMFARNLIFFPFVTVGKINKIYSR